MRNDKPILERAIKWLMSGDTGISSEAILSHMTGIEKTDSFGMQPPADADDRGRCIRLLKLMPEWVERLPEMVQYDKKRVDSGIVINSLGMSSAHDSWEKQIKLIMSEGSFKSH